MLSECSWPVAFLTMRIAVKFIGKSVYCPIPKRHVYLLIYIMETRPSVLTYCEYVNVQHTIAAKRVTAVTLTK